jgi:predicted negative regulator of RcsB-dependent stress response
MTNHKSEQQHIEHFKNWIRTRFIAELTRENLPPIDALAWSVALREMSESLNHAIVPFQRQRGKS